MAPFKVEGLMAASFTPFTPDGNVNLPVIDTYQRYLVDNGITRIYVNGTTGEGPSLTLQERKDICEAWMKYSRMPGRQMTVFVQVGAGSFKEIEELTKHAASLHVDAISTLPPLYFTPPSIDHLVDYCKRVGALAPNIPLYYYHIPDRTNIKYDMEAFLVKSRDQIPSLRGIKYTSKDLYEGSRCVRTLDRNGVPFDLLYGTDEQLLSAMAAGFRGSVGSTYNVMPGVYHRLRKAFKERDMEEARKEQDRSVDAVKLMFDYGARPGGLLAAMRCILSSVVGVEVGPPRYPQVALTQAERHDLMDRLKALGFFDWVKEKF